MARKVRKANLSLIWAQSITRCCYWSDLSVAQRAAVRCWVCDCDCSLPTLIFLICFRLGLAPDFLSPWHWTLMSACRNVMGLTSWVTGHASFLQVATDHMLVGHVCHHWASTSRMHTCAVKKMRLIGTALAVYCQRSWVPYPEDCQQNTLRWKMTLKCLFGVQWRIDAVGILCHFFF